MRLPHVSVVVLAFGPEPLLCDCVDAVLASTGVAVDLVVVDNGYTGRDAAALRLRPLRWSSPGRNTGYAGGCNYGARAATGKFLAFVNSDAILAPDALAQLVAAFADPRVGIATGKVLLLHEPGIVNSAGNPVHYSLLSWAGGWGDASADHITPADVASAGGCLLVIRRPVFEDLEGFNEALFAYGEDVELSLRAWQSGRLVRFVPSALAWHDYEFSRHPNKFYLLERNRWVNLLTLYEKATLLRLAPGLLVVEAGIWVRAIWQGWWREKGNADLWVLAHRDAIRRRRRWVQTKRRESDRVIVPLLDTRIEPSSRSGNAVPGAVNSVIGLLGRLGGGKQPSGR